MPARPAIVHPEISRGHAALRFIQNTVGLVLQNPGTKTAKLILNTLLIGVFHFLTSLRSRKGG